MFVPVHPKDVDVASALRGMTAALGAYGEVTQHAYQPEFVGNHLDALPSDPGGLSTVGDVACLATTRPDGRGGLACIGRSDVIDVAAVAAAQGATAAAQVTARLESEH